MTKPQMMRTIIANIRDDLEVSLDEAIYSLQRYKAEAEGKGFTNLIIEIDAYDEYGSSRVDIELFGERMETQNEADQRERMDKHNAEMADAYARLQYEQLKAKFG